MEAGVGYAKWSMKVKQNAIDMGTLRSICGVMLTDCFKNVEIRKRVIMKRGMLHWFRSDEEKE